MNKEMRELIAYEEKKQSRILYIADLQGRKTSAFYRSINNLVIEAEKIVEDERPWWNGNLWAERKVQLSILRAALTEAYYTQNDSELFVDCHFTLKNSTNNFFPSKYDDFKNSLKKILDNFRHQEMHLSTCRIIQDLRKRIEKLETVQNKQTVQSLKKQYVDNLRVDDDQRLLEEKLRTVSGDKILINIINELRKNTERELLKIRENYMNTLHEIDDNNRNMQNAFLGLANNLRITSEMLQKLAVEHPEYWKVLEDEFLSQSNPESLGFDLESLIENQQQLLNEASEKPSNPMLFSGF